jgi:hypothetical protein
MAVESASRQPRREPSAPGETERERLNRQLIELLNEIRVAIPGVQVLFAFLLAVPFTARFESVSSFQRAVYFVALLAAALSSALLIAPAPYHRLLFGEGQRRHVIHRTSQLLVCGLLALALAMTAVVLLVSDVMFGTATAAGVTVATAATFLGLWVILPLQRRLRLGPRARR